VGAEAPQSICTFLKQEMDVGGAKPDFLLILVAVAAMFQHQTTILDVHLRISDGAGKEAR
jgi:hypothetical protein